jgi:hypothetical protein
LSRRGASGALAVLLALAAPAAAGPWNSAPGAFYVKASYAYLATDELATPLGEVVAIPEFSRHEGSLYFQLGLSDSLMAVGDVPFFRRSAIEGFDEAAGFGDLRLGLQGQLGRSGPWVFAARGTVQVPTGDETLGAALLPSGSGVWEGEAMAGAGVSLWGGRGWGFVEAGYQVRGGALRDGLLYAAQLGRRIGSRVMLIANLRGVQPFESGPSDLSTGSAAGFGDGTTYLTFGPALIVELAGGAGLQADLDLMANTTTIARGTTLRIGLFLAR